MSHEVMPGPVVGVPRPRTADGRPGDLAQLEPDAESSVGSPVGSPVGSAFSAFSVVEAGVSVARGPDLDLDLERALPPGPVRPAPRRRWAWPIVTPVGLATVALIALLAGAAVGDAHARHSAQDQLVAGTRVLLWADSTELPGDGDREAADLSALPVTLVVAGSPVTVLRLLLGAGEADATPALALRPGVRISADLGLHPDCAVLGRDGGHPAAFTQARAVVRLPGSSGLHEVPLDVLGDPSAVLLTLLARCTADSYGVG